MHFFSFGVELYVSNVVEMKDNYYGQENVIDG